MSRVWLELRGVTQGGELTDPIVRSGLELADDELLQMIHVYVTKIAGPTARVDGSGVVRRELLVPVWDFRAPTVPPERALETLEARVARVERQITGEWRP